VKKNGPKKWTKIVIFPAWKMVPSGNLTVRYWKWPFKQWIFPLKIVIFHSYVTLPEGIPIFDFTQNWPDLTISDPRLALSWTLQTSDHQFTGRHAHLAGAATYRVKTNIGMKKKTWEKSGKNDVLVNLLELVDVLSLHIYMYIYKYICI